jgi:hypothetical protein
MSRKCLLAGPSVAWRGVALAFDTAAVHKLMRWAAKESPVVLLCEHSRHEFYFLLPVGGVLMAVAGAVVRHVLITAAEKSILGVVAPPPPGNAAPDENREVTKSPGCKKNLAKGRHPSPSHHAQMNIAAPPPVVSHRPPRGRLRRVAARSTRAEADTQNRPYRCSSVTCNCAIATSIATDT